MWQESTLCSSMLPPALISRFHVAAYTTLPTAAAWHICVQVLVATSTLAWGVNTPAHLVVIKGTEYYDAPSRRYVDFPITDVLQVRCCCC